MPRGKRYRQMMLKIKSTSKKVRIPGLAVLENMPPPVEVAVPKPPKPPPEVAVVLPPKEKAGLAWLAPKRPPELLAAVPKPPKPE